MVLSLILALNLRMIDLSDHPSNVLLDLVTRERSQGLEDFVGWNLLGLCDLDGYFREMCEILVPGHGGSPLHQAMDGLHQTLRGLAFGDHH